MKKDLSSAAASTQSDTESKSLNRRSFLGGAAAAAGAMMAPLVSSARDWSGNTPVRYPDPDVVVHDQRFAKYKLGITPIQRLNT